MTTNESLFIEEAKGAGQLFIRQPYELYSDENHQAWSKLYARMLPRWDRYANEHFLKGIACAVPGSGSHSSPRRGESIPAAV